MGDGGGEWGRVMGSAGVGGEWGWVGSVGGQLKDPEMKGDHLLG